QSLASWEPDPRDVERRDMHRIPWIRQGGTTMAGAYVVGVGMVPFATPRTARPYDELAEAAVTAALADAGVDFEQIQQSYGGYVYGDSTSAQRVIYRVAQTGIPVINVNNNCSTGSTALWLARQAVESGAADCVLAFGF